jgi:hydrogenase maturation protease
MRVAVFGIGNVLLHDDAVGPTVARLLDAGWSFPEGVVVEDLGTPALEFVTYLGGHDAVIIIDAVAARAEAGTIRIYAKEDILRHPPGLRLTPHDPALNETLLLLDLMGEAPRDVRLVGIVAKDITGGIGLTDEVRASLDAACAAVLDELARFGIEGQRKSAPDAANLWWEAA